MIYVKCCKIQGIQERSPLSIIQCFTLSKNGGEVGVQVVVRMVAKMGVRLVVTFFGTPRIFPPF